MTHDTQESDVEDIPKFYAGGKALAKGEVVVTYKDHLSAITTLQKEKEEAVAEARDQEAKLWFETWYSHYIAPKQPLQGEFGKFATERIQMTGYVRDHTSHPPGNSPALNRNE